MAEIDKNGIKRDLELLVELINNEKLRICEADSSFSLTKQLNRFSVRSTEYHNPETLKDALKEFENMLEFDMFQESEKKTPQKKLKENNNLTNKEWNNNMNQDKLKIEKNENPNSNLKDKKTSFSSQSSTKTLPTLVVKDDNMIMSNVYRPSSKARSNTVMISREKSGLILQNQKYQDKWSSVTYEGSKKNSFFKFFFFFNSFFSILFFFF